MHQTTHFLIATIGPTSGNSASIASMAKAGMTHGRLNMSHGTHQSHHSYIELLRRENIPIMVDLSGPRTTTKSGHVFDESLPSLTAKDRFDLAFAAKHKTEWVVMSYAKNVDDVNLLKDELRRLGHHAKIALKIEHATAVQNIRELRAHCDLIIIARGDLGDALGLEHLGRTTLQLVKTCREESAQVVVATEILTSLIDTEKPTRAEAMDAWLHGYVGASGIMLSNETAVGKNPVNAVTWGERLFTQGANDRKHGIQLLG